MKHEQNNTQTQSALLRSASWVDAPVNNSLCCATAGITAPPNTPEVLMPHVKLRGATSPEATPMARNWPPAQLAVGYTHVQNINLLFWLMINRRKTNTYRRITVLGAAA